MNRSAPARERSHAQQQEQALLILLIAGFVTVALAAAIPWTTATVAAWAHTGRIPHLSLEDALRAAVSPKHWSAEPARAFPRPVARLLPGGWGYWSTAAILLTMLVAAVVAGARELGARRSQAIADRRWYHLIRGSRPQQFGRYRTLRPLIVGGPAPGRVIIGRIATPRALIAAQPDVQITAIAAPRSGKTSALLIPAVLEHIGPVLTTSVRTDVVQATRPRRSELGKTWVWDPFGERSDAWDPLNGCEQWAHALLVARWLGHAMQLGHGASAEYFDEAAQELAAPLLHAAALTAERTIVDVYGWVRDRDQDSPTQILRAAGADDAIARLESVYALNDRQRDGILGTVQVQLKAYGHPDAARTATRGRGITPERLFDGGANTIYLVAGREHQRLLAPLVVTMVSALLHHASEKENRTGAPLSPRAMFALDETAQIAPLQELPQILSVSLPSVRFLTVWHSIAQMRERYGPDAAANILALCQAKVFLGSITDEYTRAELVKLLGQAPQALNGHEQWRDSLTAQALQRLQDGQGLLVHGSLAPTFFEQRRYYRDAALRRLQQVPGASA